MNPPVVVGVDGSEDALRAVDWAADEARRHGLPLRIVHASRWTYYEGLPTSRSAEDHTWEAERVAAEAEQRARLRQPDVPLRSDVLAEDPGEYLVSASAWASAVVVGSRGHGGLAGLLLGSVSLTVAARAECPVTVVRGDASAQDGWVVVGLGGPETSPAAVEYAFEEAHLTGHGVAVVHAWMCPRRESATAHTGQFDESRTLRQREAQQWLGEATAGPVSRHPDVPARQVEAEGPARDVLLEAGREAAMIVVGARRREGHLGMQLGPVGHAVLHHAKCTVTVVPEGQHHPKDDAAPQESEVTWGAGGHHPVYTPVPGR
ncbi:universal stress protein [Streptomyces sp. NPDC059740]|uniref:universal stress protein n=1 Tax=Streptomyces sp. NPDC059740 TaxID=3346926 RepID=UPI00366098C2